MSKGRYQNEPFGSSRSFEERAGQRFGKAESHFDRRPKLPELIQSKQARVGVIGLGYVGLPLAKIIAEAGFKTIGFDIDDSKVTKLNKCESYIMSVPSEALKKLATRFSATSDFTRLKEVDVIIICVPTPLTLDGKPDLSYIKATAQTIAKNLRKGQLVSLESTTYPGTTREIVLPILSKAKLACGKDFFLVFSPEREDPGSKNYTQKTIPKVVGGCDEESSRHATAFYRKICNDVIKVSSCDVAEACKIMENVYRAVNIALVNELKMLFDRMNINVWEVIEAAKTKPFGFQAFYPGPGWGGHCVPLDPFYLSCRAREFDFTTHFIELAGQINTQMPYYVVGKLEKHLGNLKGKKILILGVAYKKDIDDPRESPAFRIMELLHEKDAKLSYNDPFVPKLPKMRHFKHFNLFSKPLDKKFLASQDAAVIVTDHSLFDYDFIAKNSRLVLDTRNAIVGKYPNVIKA